ncbi:nitronate monooxygenase family protein [Bradyrhizobium prioriisuperbiae]|uniref:NAD(P)H-dependent flavin oxidoreductase n=1 Tax=Bradyrhizobium prioriisuperbiae TaxID=2854389 RepID=UPI0028ED565D|nr:nitronate monooxygenase family protein [Bradyrhizobium prioritasuperba]
MNVQEMAGKLEIPVIVAPMFLVSTPAMTLAACSEGLMGSFPAHGTRTREVFEQWLVEITQGLKRLHEDASGSKIAPFAVNLVVHPSNTRLQGDLELCIKYQVPVVLTSKGAPTDVIARIHDYGGVVLHDIASQRHAEKALEAGVDGVIAVAGGAGGHTGTINPFALMNEVRRIYRGPVVLAGGMTTGRDVLAAQAMGADFGYIGTRFIATAESSAPLGQKRMIVESNATDVFFSASIDGAPANWLTKSLLAAGADLDVLRTTLPGKVVAAAETRKRWKDIWSAGHGVGNIDDIPSTVELCRRLKTEYRAAAGVFRSAALPTENLQDGTKQAPRAIA